MGFGDIPLVERADFYLDIAFKRAKERARQVKARKGPKTRLAKIKEVEKVRVQVVRDVLKQKIHGVIKSFPQIDDLSLFYVELIRTTMDYNELKLALGALNWVIPKIQDRWRVTNNLLTKQTDLTRLHQVRRAYYGRISSFMKRIDKYLKYLDTCRKIMRKFPSIKTGVPTITISGFPNVGKTTLLFKLTGSKPEIAVYSFTTKGINMGFITKDKKRLQMLDTPGTLNRLDKMNMIEKQAFLAVKHLAKAIVYVFDPTESYPLELQIDLYKTLLEFKKPIIVYISKADITENYKDLQKKYNAFIDSEKLKEKLLQFL